MIIWLINIYFLVNLFLNTFKFSAAGAFAGPDLKGAEINHKRARSLGILYEVLLGSLRLCGVISSFFLMLFGVDCEG